jgi:ATP-binding cassette subfamily C protein LapB
LFQVAQFLTRLNQARTSLRTLNQVMAMPVERPSRRTYLHRPRLDGGIAFTDVSFRYPGAPVAAIQNASFTIQPGERVGIIGRVGSGKSTLHKLLLGLYEPDDGSILVDGTESRQIDPVDLRRNIGCVPQEVVLFRGTVRENIAIGAPQASDAAVLRAAEIATADDFVGLHPMGYDRPVGERGESLSGGQRQAIAAARAILHEPAIVLLDEPTSSMDSGAEARFKKNLTEALADKTLILITHRASLLSLVDRLVVLEAGAVVADGPKEAVLQAIAEGKVAILGGA